MKKCPTCKAIKEYIDFHKNSSTKDGYQKCCKDCMYKFNKSKNDEHDPFNLHGVTEEDYFTMYELLSMMGYDIFGDVAEQFAKKHNLKYRKRRSKIMKNNRGPEVLEKLQRNNLISDK